MIEILRMVGRRHSAPLLLVAVICAFALAGGTPRASWPAAYAQSGQVTVQGIFTVLYSHAGDQYVVIDEANTGRRTRVLLDDTTARAAGGVASLKNRRVTITGTSASESLTGPVRSRTTAIPVPVVQAHSVALATSAGARAVAVSSSDATGVSAWLTVLCKFPDVPGEPHPPSWYDALLNGTNPGVKDWYARASYGSLAITGGTLASGWHMMPHPSTQYATDTGEGFDALALAGDCLDAADAEVNYRDYFGVTFVFNDDVLMQKAGGVAGQVLLTRDGVSRVWALTWLSRSYSESHAGWVHEMGHAYGLPHSGNAATATLDNVWDLMSYIYYPARAGSPYPFVAQHMAAYDKDRLGWIPSGRRYVHGGGSSRINLDDLAGSGGSGYLIARIPSQAEPNTRYITVEARRATTNYDQVLPGSGVIIHEVDTTRLLPALVAGAGGPNPAAIPGYTSSGPAYIWSPGETYANPAEGITVRVESTTRTGYAVTITVSAPSLGITALSPAVVTRSGAPVTLAVTGVGFDPSSVVRWNGSDRPTTFVSATALTATIGAADIAAAGAATVTVYNPATGATTPARQITIRDANPAPLAMSVSPASAAPGGDAFTLTVTGAGFDPSSVVRWDGAARPTAFVSATRLTALIDAIDIATARTTAVTVSNPAPGGGVSNQLPFTVAAAPAAPANLRAGPTTSDSITILWDAAAGAAGYEVTFRPTDQPSAPWGNQTGIAGSATTWTHTGLSAGAGAYYFVRACNAAGCSPWSNMLIAANGRPALPANLRLDGIAGRDVTIRWDDIATNESGYQLAVSPAGLPGWSFGSAGPDSTSLTFRGAGWDNSFFVYLRACNNAGCSPWSNVLVIPATVPPAPASLRAVAVTETRTDVAWDDRSVNETGFQVAYRRASEAGWSSASLEPNATQLVAGGLTVGDHYYVYVRACNAAGCSAWSDGLDATNPARPEAPAHLRPGRVTGTSIEVLWDEAATNEDSYQVAYRAIDGATWSFATLARDSTSFTLDGLSGGQGFWLYVRACNVAGCSAWSSPLSVQNP